MKFSASVFHSDVHILCLLQSSPSDDIVTPADIYAKYVSQPKSILKSGKQSPKGSSVSFDVEGEGESPRPPQVKKDNVPPVSLCCLMSFLFFLSSADVVILSSE